MQDVSISIRNSKGWKDVLPNFLNLFKILALFQCMLMLVFYTEAYIYIFIYIYVMLAIYKCLHSARLETRTKESIVRASHWVL